MAVQISKLYRNNNASSNTVPIAPNNLIVVINTDEVTSSNYRSKE